MVNNHWHDVATTRLLVLLLLLTKPTTFMMLLMIKASVYRAIALDSMIRFWNTSCRSIMA
jgi:hypothetical protein